MAADEGGGKPRGDAALATEDSDAADDLDALAGGLGSLAPADGMGSGAESGDDDVPDLAALGALAARTTLTGAEAEEAALKLTTAGTAPSATAATVPSAPAAAQAQGASAKPSPASTSTLGPSAVIAAAPSIDDAALRAALSTSILDQPRAASGRAPWMMPLLVGIGVGVGIAGTLFVLSNRAAPAAAAAAAMDRETAVPAAAPVGPAAPEPGSAVPPTATVVAAAPAPAPVVGSAAGPSATPPTAEASASAPRLVQANPARPGSAAVRPAHAAAAAPAPVPSENAAAPVLAVHAAAEPAADGEPDLAAAAAENAPKAASSMDALLDEALSPKARRDELAARQQAALEADKPPPTPSRVEVTQAMTVLLPAIRGCAMGQSGLATAGIVVNGDGRVASVDVAGAPFAGTASGRCMEGVIRRARFPHFTQPSFRIKFPLAIQ